MLNPTDDTIGMSMHFDDTDPVATCLVTGCGHVSDAHRNDWGD